MNGEAIRAAREAKGMSQAQLAEAIGTVQQTVEKIESGKVARTSFLPEIYRVLGMVEASPSQVLRTILCANPTAEQILAALAANGLSIVPSTVIAPDDDDELFSIIWEPVEYVRGILEKHGLTPGGLASKVGVSPSTLTRALNDPNRKFLLAISTIRKIKEWDDAQPDGEA